MSKTDSTLSLRLDTARRIVVALSLALAVGASAAAGAAPAADAARAAVERAAADVSDIDARRDLLAAEHEALARRIARMKAAGSADILPGVDSGELDALLKTSRARAVALQIEDEALAMATERLAVAHHALRAALDTEIAATRASLPSLDADARAVEFSVLRALLDERQILVRAESAALEARDDSVELPAVDGEAHSPDELREFADEVRDHEEQARRRLAEMTKQLEALRNQRRLLRAAADFARDEALFGESERNRRVVRYAVRPVNTGTASATDKGSDTGGESRGAASSSDESPTLPRDSGGVAATQGEDPPGAPSPGPAASNESPADGRSEGGADSDGDAADGAFGAGAADPTVEFDDDGVAPAPAPAAHVPSEPPVAEVVYDGAGTVPDPTGRLVIEQHADLELMTDGIGDLSIESLGERIRLIEAHRVGLEQTVMELENRQRALDERARELEDE